MSHATYPPLDALKPVADDLWIVDSGPLRALGIPLPVRMTVVRLSNGDVWIHSPTRFDEALCGAIETLGPIRHLVAPNVAHWTYLKAWQDRCAGATTWGAPNLSERKQVRNSGVRIDKVLADEAPGTWASDLTQVVVPGGFGFREVAFFHRPSATLLLTDLVLNLEPRKMPLLLRPFLRLAGMTAPHGMPPPYVRFVVKLRKSAAAAAAKRLIAMQPKRVVFAHGAWFERDGTAALKASLRWLV